MDAWTSLGLPETLAPDAPFDVAELLRRRAAERPHQRAIVVPRGHDAEGRARWAQVTFRQLDRLVDRRARALRAAGVAPGDKVVLLVPPGIELVALVFAIFRAGAVMVLIDPGMGARAFVDCLAQVAPQALVGTWKAHAALHVVGRRLLGTLRTRIRVGGGLPFGTPLGSLLSGLGEGQAPASGRRAGDTAGILFTSGSTGPAKGVVYSHGLIAAQTRRIGRLYGIEPGEVDVPGLPGFALFSVALGATVVFPEMDYARPGRLDPARFVEAIEDHGATYSFGSPAIWGKVARSCVERGARLPSLRRVLMAGAPVPPSVHEDLRRVLPEGAWGHTPYGATEALPVASTHGGELAETFATTRAGDGTCVGRPAEGIELRVIRVVDGPIAAWSDDLLMPAGGIGELVVAGDVVTTAYEARPEATARAKIQDGARVWHRMGDLGRVDPDGRVWFCGRVGHRVETAAGLVHSGLEAVFAEEPRVARCALVGVSGRPVLVVEARNGAPRQALAHDLLALGKARPETAQVKDVLFHPGLPVDVRHNAKIRRELLATWAAEQLGSAQ